jgi:hypothetical protein
MLKHEHEKSKVGRTKYNSYVQASQATLVLYSFVFTLIKPVFGGLFFFLAKHEYKKNIIYFLKELCF